MSKITFQKPAKITSDPNTLGGFDGGPVGGYVPNMNDASAAQWRGKLINAGKANCRLEVRCQINGCNIVLLGTRDGIKISMNSSLQLDWFAMTEMSAVLAEMETILQESLPEGAKLVDRDQEEYNRLVVETADHHFHEHFKKLRTLTIDNVESFYREYVEDYQLDPEEVLTKYDVWRIWVALSNYVNSNDPNKTLETEDVIFHIRGFLEDVHREDYSVERKGIERSDSNPTG